MSTPQNTVTCAVCGKSVTPGDTRSLSDLTLAARTALIEQNPALGPDAQVCAADVARFRRLYLERQLETERGALTRLDQDVLDSLQSGLPVATLPDADTDADRTFGERAADGLARFAGSWTFIIGFCGILGIWMALNVTGAIIGVFDPFPFILLNLVLSTIAALQAPVIMMSQRRQEEKDRHRSENDYKVNLKAELEIRHLHDKIDHHLIRQWEQLSTIQRLQIELLEETTRAMRN